jgi:hypothetical protein
MEYCQCPLDAGKLLGTRCNLCGLDADPNAFYTHNECLHKPDIEQKPSLSPFWDWNPFQSAFEGYTSYLEDRQYEAKSRRPDNPTELLVKKRRTHVDK